MFRILILTLFLFSFVSAFAQTETIDNRAIIDMSNAGLSADLILKKIASSRTAFDVSAGRLIELKGAGVDNVVIAAMMDHANNSPPGLRRSPEGVIQTNRTTDANSPPVLGGVAAFNSPPGLRRGADASSAGWSAAGVVPSDYSESVRPLTRQEALAGAKTIALGKSSLQPSRQALEKELMKRKDFQKLNLTILRYKEQADLFVDIGFVSGSLITHRYVYRIYDRRSGAVITAGETTSWGSLAENLARHISKTLTAARAITKN